MPVNLDPTFRTRRVREGYDLDEVDDFVDRVLDVLEGKTGPSSALSPEAIEAYEFRVVRFRECYSMDDVDDWLDAAAAELRRAAPRREPRAAAQAADPEATQAWPAPVPAAHAHPHALVGERPGRGQPQPGRRRRHGRGAARQSEVHGG